MEQLSPGEALSRLKQLIKTGRLGVNYTFVPTEKNKLLQELFFIDDEKKKEILLSLEANDYQKDEYSNDEHTDDYMYVFIKRDFELLSRYSEEMKYTRVDIYIKFFFCGENHSPAVILSFHRAGDY